jgi:beta-glucanase (GH16 family)
MKSHFIVLLLCAVTSHMISQSVNVVDFDVDFECQFTDYVCTGFGGTVCEVTANPSSTGINSSATVVRSTKTVGSQPWAGGFLTLEDDIDFSQGEVFKMKVYSPVAGINVLLKLENNSNTGIFNEISVPVTSANTWEELSFDFSTTNASSKSLRKVVIFFDFGTSGDGAQYYFDDINQVGNTQTIVCQAPLVPDTAAPIPPPCDNLLGIYSDTFTELPGTVFNLNVGQSTIVSMQSIAGNNVLQYENFDYQRVQFQNPLNISAYSEMHVDIWCPGGTQLSLFLVNPGNVEDGYIINLNPQQWNRITIPLSAFSNVVSLSNVIHLRFDDGDDSIYFIDNLYFTGDCNDVPACPVLVWEDNFSGNSLDMAKWTPQIGDGCPSLCGWGNNELQYYREENAVVSGGTLKIIAKEETFGGRDYTSARLRTINKGDFAYGRFEASIKMPFGQGIWPAFWMLSTDEPYGFWPQSGEIDIVELLGQETDLVHATIHYGPPWPNNQSTTAQYRLNSGDFNDGFHEYAIEWDEEEIRWYLDDILYSTKTVSDVSPSNWPFDHEFHMLLNMAVGGNYPGDPDASTTFPQTMEVDYVRVYEGEFAYVQGAQQVGHMASAVVYTVGNAGAGATYNWSVPAGATIVSGQGTNSISIDWGDTSSSGIINVVVNGCSTQTLSLDVVVEPEVVDLLACVLENFDDAAVISYDGSVGVMQENINNPMPNGVNNSALVGRYTRSDDDLFDNMTYSIDNPFDISGFVPGDTKFQMNIYTSAPIGTNIILQLENSNTATPSNYPTGRHSRYQIETTKQNEWETLVFDYFDRPDAAVLEANVDQILLLFSPNSFTNDVYYFDDFEKHCLASPVILESKICGNATGFATASPGGMDTYTFFIDANLNGNMDANEQVQTGSSATYTGSTLALGSVVGVIAENLFGCTQTVTTIVTDAPQDYAFGSNGGLTGTESGTVHYETDGEIESRQTIASFSADVDYDSGKSVLLLPTFEVLSGAQFHAYIEGCSN